jgi:hypothetical protein
VIAAAPKAIGKAGALESMTASRIDRPVKTTASTADQTTSLRAYRKRDMLFYLSSGFNRLWGILRLLRCDYSKERLDLRDVSEFTK